MRRLAGTSVAAAALLVAATPGANATHSGPGGPPKDFAVGGGITAIGTHMGFSAHSGPGGEDPSGHATLKNRDPAFSNIAERKGHVVCLNVAGNRAVFGIEIDNPDPGELPFRTFLVQDNGRPRNGQPVDTIRGGGPEGTVTRPTCETVPQMIDPAILRHGNITVHDGDAR